MPRLGRLLVFAALLACANRAGPAAIDPGRSASGRTAALARITVENGTEHRLTIAFRSAAVPSPEVAVGQVAAYGTAIVAPVLAGEPIILLARTPGGAELTLPARSFGVGAHWRWVIPPKTVFGGMQGERR